MRCIYCNSLINDDSNYCKFCGNDLSAAKNKMKDDSDKLERAFVGDKYDYFKKSPFNVGAFFLGPFYLLYRKMYLITFIYIIVAGSIPIISNIILAFIVNYLYLEHVKSKVKDIKNSSTLSTDSILDICEKKGGVSFVAPLIYFIIIVGILALAIYGIYKIDEQNDHFIEKSNIDEELIYDIPNGFEERGYNSYYSFNTNHNCTINIESKYVDNENIDNYSNGNDVSTEIINGAVWFLTIDKNNTGMINYKYIIFKDKAYFINYYIYKDDDKFCSKSFDTFKNTIKFVDNSSTEA